MDSKIRCKRCNSTQTYIRRKTKERVCKNCGFAEKLSSKELKDTKEDILIEN